MPACRLLVANVFTNYDQLFLMGRCVGTVETIAAHVDDVCSPRGVTSGQAVTAVVKYIDDRPARMHENFRRLALEALQAAWPCTNR